MKKHEFPKYQKRAMFNDCASVTGSNTRSIPLQIITRRLHAMVAFARCERRGDVCVVSYYCRRESVIFEPSIRKHSTATNDTMVL